MPVHLGSAAINAAYLGASAVDKVYLGANAVYTALAPPAQVTGLAVDSTGDGTIDLSWTAPASDATITDYSVEYTDVQPLTGVALLAPFDADLDDVLGITATATNTPTVTSGGKFGSYADIDVADKLVYSGISDGGGDWTVEFFIKRTQAALSGTGYENFANPVLTIPGVLRLVTTLSSTAVSVQEDDFGSWSYTSPSIDTVAFDAEWHHIALVRDGSTLRCYLDGTQLGSFASSGSVTSLEFGASTVYGGVFGLDDLRVSTSAVYPSGTTFTPPTVAHPTSGGGTTATVLVGSASTSYQLTSLTIDTEYSVRVAAVSAAGTGEYSTAVTGTAGAATRGFVAVANSTAIAASSTDGSTWTQQALPVSAQWYSVTYGGGLFVAIAQSSNIAATSTDGITWTQQTLSDAKNWYSVTYGGGMFVAVGTNTDIATTSPDGITWTSRTLPASGNWYSVTYGDGLFAAVMRLSETVATSPDGITWTQQTVPQAFWTSLAHGNGTFVLVSEYGDAAATSPDGVTWTSRTLPASGTWRVAFGNSTFVAISEGTATAATSPDGVTWTTQTLPSAETWRSVAFNNGLFVAVANNSDKAATSPDGVTWTAQTLPISTTWQGVA